MKSVSEFHLGHCHRYGIAALPTYICNQESCAESFVLVRAMLQGNASNYSRDNSVFKLEKKI
jgi:hypothetical protein